MRERKYEIWSGNLDTFAPSNDGVLGFETLNDGWKKLRELRLANPTKAYDFLRLPEAGQKPPKGKYLVRVRPERHDKALSKPLKNFTA